MSKKKGKTDSERLKEKIRHILNKNPLNPISYKLLSRAINAKSPEKKAAFKSALRQLIDKGSVIEVRKNFYQIAQKTDYLEGIVDFVNPKFAYIIVEGQEEDIWVHASNLQKALHEDKVKVELLLYKNRYPEGRVVEVLERKRTEFIGTVETGENFAFVNTNGKKMHYDIFVNNSDLNGAKDEDKVVVEITSWRKNEKNPTGRIKKILGKAGKNDTEIHSIMFEFGLPFEFPSAVNKASDRVIEKIEAAEIGKRRDFRDITTFTIDPLTAKDFDDALSIQKVGDKLWEVGVHIADVSHYVTEDSALDKEASERATSVYLVDRTIPMLPEKISNGVCSLNPHEDKLTFSAVFTLDENGIIKKEWFGKTIIHSDRRFTYEEAQERIEAKTGDFSEEIILLNSIAKKLQKKRFSEGAISFESVEFSFVLDEQGNPLEVIPKVRKDAHKLIEEFMLLANKRVAEFIAKKKTESNQPTMIYRVHENPDQERIQQLALFIKRFGYSFNPFASNIADEFNKLSVELEGTPFQNIIEMQAIRSMAKAIYTTENLGHFGLGFDYYTHFTSPIRRYPDLLVHRILHRYLQEKTFYSKEEMEHSCKHSSSREKVAVEAERASIKYKQAEFMQKYIGEEMEGIVSGVTNWGLYVELTETKCEGMVRVNTISDDYYYYDEENLRIVGKKYKKTYSMGDKVNICVLDTNLDKRTIDFELI